MAVPSKLLTISGLSLGLQSEGPFTPPETPHTASQKQQSSTEAYHREMSPSQPALDLTVHTLSISSSHGEISPSQAPQDLTVDTLAISSFQNPLKMVSSLKRIGGKRTVVLPPPRFLNQFHHVLKSTAPSGYLEKSSNTPNSDSSQHKDNRNQFGRFKNRRWGDQFTYKS